MNQETVTYASLVALFLSAISGSVYAIEESIRSNGEVDYCYVQMYSPERMAPQWELFGHRPWREDRMFGVYPDADKAREAAALFGCKLNSK